MSVKINLIDDRHIISNIFELYQKASISDIYHGARWYKEANNIAKLYSYIYSVPLIKVCAVISALSPRVKWSTNLVATDILLNSYVNGGISEALNCRIAGFHSNKKKAIAILDNWEATFKLYDTQRKSGHKTANFANNILNYSDGNFVTIDNHAINIALGTVGIQYKGLSKKQYDTVVCAYKDAAQELNLLSCDLQAITWLTYKRINRI